jgi:hypothetical protein
MYPVPPALDDIVLACLAKDPADRPVSARELADWLTSCEVEAPWRREDARGWWETHLHVEQPVVFEERVH